ncbi:small integral membrane protein 43-like [Anguilla rostrata]|uniref:small integral membrane protein 43-like n=1 Tax=Anguilla rostrata TaxID=7938 RepID=UPI0030CC8D55
MPSPRRFLETSTSFPLAAGWGWNVCIYLGLFAALFLLMVLLLWLLIRQLRNSVGNSALQPGRSVREPLGQVREHVL